MRKLLFLTIGATIFAIGESVQCYNCAEVSEGEVPGIQKCLKPFSANDTNSKCDVSGYCMKGVGSMDGLSVTMRQCVPLGNIPNFDGDHPPAPADPIEMQLGHIKVTAHFCESDLCNAASFPTPTTSFAILLLTTLFLFV